MTYKSSLVPALLPRARDPGPAVAGRGRGRPIGDTGKSRYNKAVINNFDRNMYNELGAE